MARSKYLSLEEARKQGKIDRFCFHSSRALSATSNPATAPRAPAFVSLPLRLELEG